MIKIKQYNGKWRIEIENEEFEFEDSVTMKQVLGRLIDLKETYGNLKHDRHNTK